MQVNITPCLQNKRLTSLPFHVMYGFQTAIDKRKRGRLDFDLMKVDEGAIEWNSLNELRKLNECMVPTQHLQHIQTIEWIKVLQIHFVLILVMSLENLWIKFFSPKLAPRPDMQILSFRKIISFASRHPSFTYMWPHLPEISGTAGRMAMNFSSDINYHRKARNPKNFLT